MYKLSPKRLCKWRGPKHRQSRNLYKCQELKLKIYLLSILLEIKNQFSSLVFLLPPWNLKKQSFFRNWQRFSDRTQRSSLPWFLPASMLKERYERTPHQTNVTMSQRHKRLVTLSKNDIEKHTFHFTEIVNNNVLKRGNSVPNCEIYFFEPSLATAKYQQRNGVSV